MCWHSQQKKSAIYADKWPLLPVAVPSIMTWGCDHGGRCRRRGDAKCLVQEPRFWWFVPRWDLCRLLGCASHSVVYSSYMTSEKTHISFYTRGYSINLTGGMSHLRFVGPQNPHSWGGSGVRTVKSTGVLGCNQQGWVESTWTISDRHIS